MIKKEENTYILQCDFCSNCIEDFEDFYDALDYKKANKWKNVNFKDEWLDKCECCLEKERRYKEDYER